MFPPNYRIMLLCTQVIKFFWIIIILLQRELLTIFIIGNDIMILCCVRHCTGTCDAILAWILQASFVSGYLIDLYWPVLYKCVSYTL